MATKIRVINPDSKYREKRIDVYETQAFNQQAKFACALLEKWGPVMATTDGEDTAGRSKKRPATPVEIVEKVCAITDAAFAEFGKRGWMLAVPDLAEINAKAEKEEEATPAVK